MTLNICFRHAISTVRNIAREVIPYIPDKSRLEEDRLELAELFPDPGTLNLPALVGVSSSPQRERMEEISLLESWGTSLGAMTAPPLLMDLECLVNLRKI